MWPDGWQFQLDLEILEQSTNLHFQSFLRVKESETKWESGHIQNWAMVMNLLLQDELKDRALKHLE